MPKRLIALIAALSVLFAGCCGRLSYIIFSGNYLVSSGYNSYKLVIGKTYENVYDCNMKKMNNNEKRIVAVIKPNEKCLSELSLLFSQNEIKEIIEELSAGYPIVKEVRHYASCKSIKLFEVYHSEKQNYAVNSVIKEFNSVAGEKSISFAVDAKGRLLDGDNEDITNDNYNGKSGVQITIDGRIQQFADEEIVKISKGAIVITDVNTNNILAMSSAGGDGVNRCISNNAVGSVFKLIVAACALENGVEQNYYCKGSITVGDTEFSCQNKTAHKSQNMQTALQNSCNCYFINLALTLGSERLLKTARDFGFENGFALTEDFTAACGILPSENDLKLKGELALLGFGQGKLTVSPLAICSAVAAIANGGKYNEPVLLNGTVDGNGSITKANYKPSRIIMSDETSDTLRRYMRAVVENGTGKNADYKGQSAGKTSTAQSGRYIDGKEVLITWFAGFYPYDNPKYAITVMVENGNSGAGDCCPIFRSLVEKLDNL